MNMEKKSTIIKVLITVLVVATLVATMTFALTGCSKNKPTQTDPTTQTEPSGTESTDPKPTDPQVTTYTVTFQDHDGTVLKTETVEEGKAATAPANPSREHFTFAGWDKSFNNVTSDLVVTATYTTSKIVISAESVTVNKGTGEVTVNIRVYNNPGIMGAVLKVSVNDQIFSFKSASKAGFPGLTLTSPGPSTTSSPYTFMLDALELSGEDRKDGTLFSITFKIDNPNATGTYDVKLSYNNNGIFDENYNYPNVVLENGTITIK